MIDQRLTIPALPVSLRWKNNPVNWSFNTTDQWLSITAGKQTDWFLDPGGVVNIVNAPALLAPVHEPCMLQARVSSDASATFDAGVLTVYQADEHWGKLCFERSPQGQLMVVSVVTRGASDDCNSVPIDGQEVYLRVSVLENAFAFHYSLDGKFWNLIRYFTLGERKFLEIGFLSQSPTGQGCTARFSEIAFKLQKLTDLRSGI